MLAIRLFLSIFSPISSSVQDVGLRQFLLKNIVKKDKHFTLKVNPHIIASNLDTIMGFPNLDPSLQFTGKTFFIGGAKSNYIS